MRAIRWAFLTLSVLTAASLGRAQEKSPEDWKPLADFESVEAFERQLSEDQEECLANSGGGSMAVICFKLSELWDRELNIQYERLRENLDAPGREKLKESQRAWLASRDATIAFASHVFDRSYSAPGTMWIAIRADVADTTLAGIVRERALLLREWEARWARGPIDEETLLNE